MILNFDDEALRTARWENCVQGSSWAIRLNPILWLVLHYNNSEWWLTWNTFITRDNGGRPKKTIMDINIATTTLGEAQLTQETLERKQRAAKTWCERVLKGENR